MKTNLGKVAITPKGTWNSTTVYTALDTVNFGGGSWLAKRGNIAVTPTEGDDWMQLSAKGADAELTKDSIVSALGYTPERDYGNYELIETITLTEDTAQIIRTKEPDGTAYALRGVMLVVDFAPTTTQSGNVPAYYALSTGIDIRSYFINPRDASKVKHGFSKIWIDRGYWLSGWWSCASEEGAYGYRNDNVWNYGRCYAGSTGTVNRLMISSVPANSIIRIYGIRK